MDFHKRAMRAIEARRTRRFERTACFLVCSQPHAGARENPLPDYAGAARLLRGLGSCE